MLGDGISTYDHAASKRLCTDRNAGTLINTRQLLTDAGIQCLRELVGPYTHAWNSDITSYTDWCVGTSCYFARFSKNNPSTDKFTTANVPVIRSSLLVICERGRCDVLLKSCDRVRVGRGGDGVTDFVCKS